MLDRLDLQVEVPALTPRALQADPDPSWSTEEIRKRVLSAVDRQRRRHGGRLIPNGRLQDADLERAFGRAKGLGRTLEEVLRIYRLSGRARVRLMRIARTLADLADRDDVLPEDIQTAARLRGFAAGMSW